VHADETDQDNVNKPFYTVIPLSNTEAKATVKLAPAEVAMCKVPQFTGASFEVTTDLCMEYSKVAEEGIADMVEIDELNNATLL